MGESFAFVGAALSVVFLMILAMTVWHCGFSGACYSLVLGGM